MPGSLGLSGLYAKPSAGRATGDRYGPRSLFWEDKLDRYAIFVDAGYVLAEGGKLCIGSDIRKYIELDVVGLQDYLHSIAKKRTNLPGLRLYWYDATPYDSPTTEQNEIAKLPNIKLRLGKMKRGRQKGVDALIYHDLISLARERAICEAFLLSGDEDLREGVKTVQAMGVRVTLIGIKPSDQYSNQSRELRQEADEVIVLQSSDISKFFSKRRKRIDHINNLSIAEKVGSDLAEKVYGDSTDKQLHAIMKASPSVPGEIDSNLLYALRRELSKDNVDSQYRKAARSSFWATLNKLHTSTS